METKSEKQMGNVDLFSCDLKGFYTANIPKMTMNKLTLLTGQNASGKSVIMKFIWFLTTSVNNALVAQKELGLKNFDDLIPSMQALLDGTFINNDLTGNIYALLECKSDINVVFENGKIKSIVINCPPDVTYGAQPIYMSAQTRLLNSFDMYLTVKKYMKLGKMTDPGFDLEELLKTYRIYDIFFFEKMLGYYEKGYKLKADLVKTLKDTYDFKEEVSEIFLNQATNSLYYRNSSGVEKHVSCLSAGEQSLVNMFVSSNP